MPKRIWKTNKAEWDTLSNLKRIYLDVAGRAKGYIVVFKNNGSPVPIYFAGAAPHLTEYPTEREAKENALSFTRDMVLTLPGEIACRSIELHHIAGLGEHAYTVGELRPHLLNPLPRDEDA